MNWVAASALVTQLSPTHTYLYLRNGYGAGLPSTTSETGVLAVRKGLQSLGSCVLSPVNVTDLRGSASRSKGVRSCHQSIVVGLGSRHGRHIDYCDG